MDKIQFSESESPGNLIILSFSKALLNVRLKSKTESEVNNVNSGGLWGEGRAGAWLGWQMAHVPTFHNIFVNS